MTGADLEKNLTGFQPLLIIEGWNPVRYIYMVIFWFLNLYGPIREFLILGFFVKKTSAVFIKATTPPTRDACSLKSLKIERATPYVRHA